MELGIDCILSYCSLLLLMAGSAGAYGVPLQTTYIQMGIGAGELIRR